MNSLKNAAFNELGDDLKEKVAQKFIDNEIDVNNDSVIKENLAAFIEKVKDEKQKSEITLKIEEDRNKAVITNVADHTTTEFVFDSFEKLRGFVDALDGKEITGTEGVNVVNLKICGHKRDFEITSCVKTFFYCIEAFSKFDKLNIPKLTLEFKDNKLYFNGEDCSGEDYFKTIEFWGLVKDHIALFNINDKFEIVKKGEDKTIKIENFESSLKWGDVVEGENTLKKGSGWDKIFKFKK